MKISRKRNLQKKTGHARENVTTKKPAKKSLVGKKRKSTMSPSTSSLMVKSPPFASLNLNYEDNALSKKVAKQSYDTTPTNKKKQSLKNSESKLPAPRRINLSQSSNSLKKKKKVTEQVGIDMQKDKRVQGKGINKSDDEHSEKSNNVDDGPEENIPFNENENREEMDDEEISQFNANENREKSVTEEIPHVLTDLRKLTYTGSGSTSGFLENFLNAIRYKKQMFELFQTAKRYLFLDKKSIRDEINNHPNVIRMRPWRDYFREVKYYMMLIQVCTHYSFKKKYFDRVFTETFIADISLLHMNTIYAIVFFGSTTIKTYTVFTARETLYAGDIFEREVNLYGNLHILKDYLWKHKFDQYDIFEFKSGLLTHDNVMVKYEELQGDGTASKPIEFD